jgi:hypothetical protein
MKYSNWKQTAELVGIAAIVASLVLVAYELRQNSEIAAAEADATRYLAAVESYSVIAENEALAELLRKACSGQNEELTDIEQYRLLSWWTRVLLLNQWGYRRIPASEYRPFVEMQRRNDRSCPSYREAFEQRRHFYTPGFISFMHEEVFDQE